MKNKIYPGQQDGMVLVGVIALMLIAGLFITGMSSIVFTSAGSHNHSLQGTQALAIAQAGSEWYFETLRTDADWTNEADSSRNFSEGNFRISILSRTAQEVRFRSTGTVPSVLTGGNFQRFEEWTVQKISPAFKFAVFQGVAGGDLKFESTGSAVTRVSGSVWSPDNVEVKSGSRVALGKIFVPSGKNVTGSGTYVKKQIASPYPVMPALDTASYNATMNGFDVLLDANTSTTDLNLNNAVLTVNGVMNYRNVTVRGNSTIRGSGTIVASGSIDLLTTAGALNTRLFIIPYSNSINFIANHDIDIGATTGYPSVLSNGTTVYYSRSSGRHIRILGANNLTSIENGKFYARNRIEIQGAVIFGNSLLYLDAAPGAGNQISIAGDATHTVFHGNILSVSNLSPAIDIDNNETTKSKLEISALIYGGGSTGNSSCRIKNAYILGSVVCNHFENNEISYPDIAYQQSAAVPAGFENSISKKNHSWDGL